MAAGVVVTYVEDHFRSDDAEMADEAGNPGYLAMLIAPIASRSNPALCFVG